MTTYDLGAPVKSVWSGAPTGGTPAVAIKRPDGTSFTHPGVTSSGEGASVTFVPDMAGRWFLAWTSSVKPGAYTDIVDVWPPDPRFLISVDDARSALGFTSGNVAPGWVDSLRLYIAAATPVIEDIVGTIVPATFTQTIRKGWNFAALYERPVNTISSVAYADASVVDPATYRVNIQTGMLTLDSNVHSDATITYTAGVTAVPPNVRLAARELVRHWWQQGMQAQHTGEITQEVLTFNGFAVPRRVMELCSPNSTPGGFA
jgi:hypothetical protein